VAPDLELYVKALLLESCTVMRFDLTVCLAAIPQVHLKIQWVPDRDASAPRHGQTPAGNIHVTADRAAGLKKPDKIIRDLSTYVDYTSAYVALVCFAVYLLAGFAFYQVRAMQEHVQPRACLVLRRLSLATPHLTPRSLVVLAGLHGSSAGTGGG
jgi:hypothetical protein